MIDGLFERFLELSPDADRMSVETLVSKGAKTRHRKHLVAYFEHPGTRPMVRVLDDDSVAAGA